METKEKKVFAFFWGGNFSQWAKSKFIIDGVQFSCGEQYMMYKKALMFNDYEAAKKIMSTSNPKEQKQYGREVKGFKDDVWTKYCREIVYDANVAKFTQNKDMYDELMFTAGRTLVEASPLDRRWGIGLAADNPFAQDRSTWQGTNWLGEAIERVREDLISGKIEMVK